MMSEQIPSSNVRDFSTQLQSHILKEAIGKNCFLKGTVKGKFQSARGHIYFELEDKSWSIYCMLSADVANQLSFTIQNNMDVEIYGDIGFYDRKCQIQLQIQQIRLIERPAFPDFGEAEKYLKSKGLWGLPPIPLPTRIKNIYLITSERSKAVADFRAKYADSAVKAKVTPAQILVEDVPLEGELAPRRIADAIQNADSGARADVIVLTRGGGAFSALATFNDPIIAEAICRSKTPIVVGVGHEEDRVFAEKVADVRAISPTDAADKIVEAQQQSHKTTPCAPVFTLLMTLLSGVISLVLLFMILVI